MDRKLMAKSWNGLRRLLHRPEYNRRASRPTLEVLEDRTLLTAGFAIHLTDQHVDIGLGFEDGQWDLHVHNETDDVEAAPDEAMLFVGPGQSGTSTSGFDNPLPRPSDPQWDFLGVGSGADVWVLPQSPDPDLMLLGVAAEEVTPGTFATYLETDPRVNGTGEWIKLTLKDFRKVDAAGNELPGDPGDFSLYSIDGGNLKVWMATSDGLSAGDAVYVLTGQHTDLIFAFTGPGFYEVDFQASAFLDDGSMTPTQSEVATYRFAVENFLTTEHNDVFAVDYDAGSDTWTLETQDQDHEVDHLPEQALHWVDPAARGPRPGGSQFDFLGVPSGTDVWTLPEVQDPDLLYAGSSAEGMAPGSVAFYTENDPRIGGEDAAWVKFALKDVRGPGDFSVWSSGTFGDPIAWMTSADGVTDDDVLFTVEGGHLHFNWTFTSRGFYEVDVQAQAFLDDGSGGLVPIESQTVTYYFQVEEPGWLRFDSETIEVNENAGTATVTVVRTGSDGPVTVQYATSIGPGDTASAADFTSASGTLSFADGETEKTFTVPITNDALPEGNETLTLTLSNPTGGGRLGGIATAKLVILDDENSPPVASDDGPYAVAEDGVLNVSAAQGVLANDTNTPANETLTAILVTGVPAAQGVLQLNPNGSFTFTPEPSFFGSVTFTYKANDGLDDSNVATVTITVNPVADTPSVTNATTDEDTQSTTGLVVSRNATDGAEVTHFKITNITGGTLFKNDGVTPIANGAFLTFAEANAGLKFTPTPDSFAPGSFQAQASTSASDVGLGGDVVTATINVNPVADTPSVTNATTDEDTQSTTGLVVSRNATDGAEVTHFKITNITGGTLFQNDGVTPIPDGTFLTFAEASAGLKFTPTPGATAAGSFQVQASTSAADAGLGGTPATATVTVNAVNDAPTNTVPGPQTVPSSSVLTFSTANGNALSVTDVDAGANPIRVTLTATNGTLTLGNTSGLVFTTGDGTADATMTFSGTVAAIVTALDGLSFTPTLGHSGAASIQMTTDDLGNTGGGALSDTDTVAITVAPLPVVAVPTPIPDVAVQYVKPRRGRVRLLRVMLASPSTQPVKVLVRIPLRRRPGVRRTRFVTGVVTINPGETVGELVFRVRGNPPVEPRRIATLELSNEASAVLRELRF